jgi:hypothetical protein
MPEELLSTTEAARRLGVTVASLYDWLSQSDRGFLIIRGKPVTINYLQGGAHGQGRIKIATDEVERLKDQMRVRPQRLVPRRPPVRQNTFPGITVPLGRPPRVTDTRKG